MTDTTRGPRRSPTPDERKVDAERSRRALIEAAMDVFSAKGYAGARVQDIADRAGVNKQLINYYFGGKEGLYCELGRLWLVREDEFNDSALPLDEVMVRYLRHTLDDPRGTRLNLWRGLTEDLEQIEPGPPEDLSDLERRQAAGELAADLDPAAVMLVLTAAVSITAAMPLAVRRIFGLSPDSPEFQERYAEQLSRIVRHLAGPSGQTTPDAPTA
ncbi:TetR/AcrR family transcriptional regulator [Actinomadura xylanilytica]|uniref:TetR/AcrR family transcriptional regulator n=1 Tax=Actinomadura xylanilytica TaxID=887459 RepID=UPI00255A8A1E|nr:TetR family transcriptional regulator [Actinomadura xylanilytica]MDL4775707.1 TetR family transcriptional regulator [Actinomadura xylanilytica]